MLIEEIYTQINPECIAYGIEWEASNILLLHGFYRCFLQATWYSTVSILAAIFDFLQRRFIFSLSHLVFRRPNIFKKNYRSKRKSYTRSKNVQPAKSLEALQHLYIFLSLAKVSQRKYIIAQATLQRAQRDIRTSNLSFSCDKALCVKTKITIVFQRCSSLYPFFSFPMPHE